MSSKKFAVLTVNFLLAPILLSMYWLPLVIAGASALASYLSGRNKNKTETSSTEDLTQTTTPNLDPEIKSARSTVLDQYLQRLNGSEGYMTGYAGMGMKNINRGNDLKRTALENVLSARGLGASPVSSALLQKQESDAWGQQTDFLNQLPLVQRQLQTDDLNQLAAIIASSPYGQTARSVGTRAGNSATFGSASGAIGSGIENGIAAFLAAKKAGVQ